MLFTEDHKLAIDLQRSVDFEPIDIELICNLDSAGVSLLNDVTKKEVLYAGTCPSAVP